jgi:hypothetical protein
MNERRDILRDGSGGAEVVLELLLVTCAFIRQR